jgi:hypothetical protein
MINYWGLFGVWVVAFALVLGPCYIIAKREDYKEQKQHKAIK